MPQDHIIKFGANFGDIKKGLLSLSKELNAISQKKLKIKVDSQTEKFFSEKQFGVLKGLDKEIGSVEKTLERVSKKFIETGKGATQIEKITQALSRLKKEYQDISKIGVGGGAVTGGGGGAGGGGIQGILGTMGIGTGRLGALGRVGGFLGRFGGPLAIAGLGVWGAKKMWNMAQPYVDPMLGLHALGYNQSDIRHGIVSTGLNNLYSPLESMAMGNQFLRAGGKRGMEMLPSAMGSARGFGADFGAVSNIMSLSRRSGGDQNKIFETIMSNAVDKGVERAQLPEYLESIASSMSDVVSRGPADLSAMSGLIRLLSEKGGGYFAANPAAAAGGISSFINAIQGQAGGGAAFGPLMGMLRSGFPGMKSAMHAQMLMEVGPAFSADLSKLNMNPASAGFYGNVFGPSETFSGRFAQSLLGSKGFGAYDPLSRYSMLHSMGMKTPDILKLEPLFNAYKGAETPEEKKQVEEDFNKKWQEAIKDLNQTTAGQLKTANNHLEDISFDVSYNGPIVRLLAATLPGGIKGISGTIKSVMTSGVAGDEFNAAVSAISKDIGTRTSISGGANQKIVGQGGRGAGWSSNLGLGFNDVTTSPGVNAGIINKLLKAPITSSMGPRFNKKTGRMRQHKGVDLGLPYGSQFNAPESGEIVFAGEMQGYGNAIIYKSSVTGYETLVGHLSGFDESVKKGYKFSKGQNLATTGGVPGTPGAGRSSGAHLHYEVRNRKGELQDPRAYLTSLLGESIGGGTGNGGLVEALNKNTEAQTKLSQTIEENKNVQVNQTAVQKEFNKNATSVSQSSTILFNDLQGSQ